MCQTLMRAKVRNYFCRGNCSSLIYYIIYWFFECMIRLASAENDLLNYP